MKGWVCSTGVALKFREHEKISCCVREEALMKKIKEIMFLVLVFTLLVIGFSPISEAANIEGKQEQATIQKKNVEEQETEEVVGASEGKTIIENEKEQDLISTQSMTSAMENECTEGVSFSMIIDLLSNFSDTIQNLWWLVTLGVLILALMTSLFLIRKKANKYTDEQIKKLIHDGKYIPGIFVELNNSKEVLRYFVYGKKWRKRLIKNFNYVYDNSYGEILKKACDNQNVCFHLNIMASPKEILESVNSAYEFHNNFQNSDIEFKQDYKESQILFEIIQHPVMRSFPELLDVGIMGHCNGGQYCRNAGIDCYQKGFTTYAPHMSYENFMEIVKQAAGKTFQIALGGAGDPNKHPQIEDILKSCRAYRIIPNMTTSGFLITDNEVGLIKQYCGAVAVSWYSRFMDGKESNQETIDAVERLVKSGCTTNIHYVVSKDTINEAITRLEMDSFPKGVNAVIFILYKPVGNGIIEKVLKNTDSRIERFISLATKVKHPYRVGFDTCFTPALLRWGDTVPAVSIDACEAATFSMYIDSQMNCYPCSFGIWDKNISESMNSKTLREIWRGDKFVAFREQRKVKCSSCRQMKICQGGCRLGIDIDMC